MAANKRSIQFRRNSSAICSSREETIRRIEENRDSYCDGEQIYGRYYGIDPDTSAETIVTLVALVYRKENGKDEEPTINITYSDISHINEEIIQIKKEMPKELVWGEF